MNRVLTALALSGMFVAAPAFAKVSHQGRRPSTVSKSVAGDKAGEAKSGETKPAEAKPAEGSTEPAAKPTKKKSKKSAKTAEPAAPAAEGAPSK